MRYQRVLRLLLGMVLMVGLPCASAAETPETDPEADTRLPDLQLPPYPPLSQFNEILERPLFSPTRTPDANDGSEFSMATEEELKDQWRLTGIMLFGDELKALLRQRNGDQSRVLSIGMPLDDTWVVAEIRSNNVLLRAGDVEVQMELREPRETQPKEVPSDRTATGNGAGEAASQPDEPQPKEVSNE